MTASDRLFVALDVAEPQKARGLVSTIGRQAGYKVGLELFHAGGPELVRGLTHAGHRIFLDLKYHDIPNTVGRTVRQAVDLGVFMFNVHALGGEEMLRRAVAEAADAAAAGGATPPLVIAVTILTSLHDEELPALGLDGTSESLAVRLAVLARSAGADGVVCSPHEVRAVKTACGDDFITVTPGIRPAGSAPGDQGRVMTPEHAMAAGADYLVVGRPITRAPDPALACRSILAGMERGLAG